MRWRSLFAVMVSGGCRWLCMVAATRNWCWLRRGGCSGDRSGLRLSGITPHIPVCCTGKQGKHPHLLFLSRRDRSGSRICGRRSICRSLGLPARSLFAPHGLVAVAESRLLILDLTTHPKYYPAIAITRENKAARQQSKPFMKRRYHYRGEDYLTYSRLPCSSKKSATLIIFPTSVNCT